MAPVVKAEDNIPVFDDLTKIYPVDDAGVNGLILAK